MVGVGILALGGEFRARSNIIVYLFYNFITIVSTVDYCSITVIIRDST